MRRQAPGSPRQRFFRAWRAAHNQGCVWIEELRSCIGRQNTGKVRTGYAVPVSDDVLTPKAGPVCQCLIGHLLPSPVKHKQPNIKFTKSNEVGLNYQVF